MSNYLSIKFKGLSFVAAICVVIIHCPLNERGNLSDIVILGFSQWAVPFFFLVAGYFHLRSLSKYTCIELIKRNVKSLIVPYLVWCVIRMCIGGNLAMICNPLSAFGLTSVHPTANMTLWFIRMLIVFKIITILIHHICLLMLRSERGKHILEIVVASSFFTIFILRRVEQMTGPSSCPVYFMIGYALALIPIDILDRKFVVYNRVLMLLLAVVLLLDSCILTVTGVYSSMILRNLLISVQIAALWLLYDSLFAKNAPVNIKRWMEPTFILFCSHGMILDVFKNIWSMAFGSGYRDVAFLLFATVTPVLIISASLLIRNASPRVYCFLSGGRK